MAVSELDEFFILWDHILITRGSRVNRYLKDNLEHNQELYVSSTYIAMIPVNDEQDFLPWLVGGS